MTHEETVMRWLRKVEAAEGFEAATALASAVRGMISEAAARSEEHRLSAVFFETQRDAARHEVVRLRSELTDAGQRCLATHVKHLLLMEPANTAGEKP